MFTKNPNSNGALVDAGRPASAPRRNADRLTSVIGADLTIIGNLDCKGEVQIDGKVEGDVHAQRIVIGEQAHMTGNLVAEAIEVRGSVQGSVRGNSVIFQSTSRVEADVFHKSLAIEQGAAFEGKSRRSDNPLSPQAANGSVLQPSRT